MAANAEKRMNLASLQQRDPFITAIVETASQVALYSFKSDNQEWEKTEIEGTLFVYHRSAAPINGFMILNRLGLNDLIEPLNNLEFQLQLPFLLYKNANVAVAEKHRAIYGIWFYNTEECLKIGRLVKKLIPTKKNIPDIVPTETRVMMPSLSTVPLPSHLKGNKMQNKEMPSSKSSSSEGHVDILQMLNKAQNEYDSGSKSSQSDQQMNNPQSRSPRNLSGSAAMKKKQANSPRQRKGQNSPRNRNTYNTQEGKSGSSRNTPQNPADMPVRPTPFHISKDQSGVERVPSTPGGTQISLATLFQTAHANYQPTSPHKGQHPGLLVVPNLQQPNQQQPLPQVLQDMMNPPPVTLEEVERDQQPPKGRQRPRESMPQPAGEEAPAPPAANPPLGARKGFQPPVTTSVGGKGASPGHSTVPDSPNTVLKRTLNIGGKEPGRPGQVKVPASSPGVQTSLATTQGVLDISTHLQRTSISDRLRAPMPSALPTPNLAGSGGGMVVTPSPSSGSPSITGAPSESPSANVQSPDAPAVLLTPSAFSSTSSSHGPRIPSQGSTDRLDPAPGPSADPGHHRSGQVRRPARHGSPAGDDSDQESDINPLTKQQLQQSLIYLLKNDDNFLSTIHRGYVESLQLNLRHDT